jgi:O-antigen/teichoic acid export membrane protein
MIRMLRSVSAVVVGYLPFGVSAVLLFKLTGRDPHAPAPLGFMLLSTLYGVAFAILSGYLAARLAGRRPLSHAIAVAGIIGLGALISIVLRPVGAALWSQMTALVLMAPSASLGGLIHRRRLGRPGPTSRRS